MVESARAGAADAIVTVAAAGGAMYRSERAKTVQRRFTGNRDIRNIMVSVNPLYDSAAVQASIGDLLRERRNLEGGEPDNFNIFDTAQISETLSGTTRILTALLGAVAAGALFAFTDATPVEAARYLQEHGIEARVPA